MKYNPFVLLILSAFITAAGWQDDEKAASAKRGELVYSINCVSCHMDKGEGMPGVFPPLAASDYLLADPDRAVGHIIAGVTGQMTVNGQMYFGEMPAQDDLNDRQVADVMNFIMNSWGNKSEKTWKPEEIAVLRAAVSE